MIYAQLLTFGAKIQIFRVRNSHSSLRSLLLQKWDFCFVLNHCVQFFIFFSMHVSINFFTYCILYLTTHKYFPKPSTNSRVRPAHVYHTYLYMCLHSISQTDSIWSYIPLFFWCQLECISLDSFVTSFLRLTITASCPMNLQYFPMDRQLCYIEIESCKLGTVGVHCTVIKKFHFLCHFNLGGPGSIPAWENWKTFSMNIRLL